MSSVPSYDSTQNSIANDVNVGFTPSLESFAVALTFSQTLQTFSEEAPSKIKWCSLSNNDMKRFLYYDIIEESDRTMGKHTVWQLKEWAQRLLDILPHTFNFSTKQIRTIADNEDFLLNYDTVFTGASAPVGNRKLGQLRTIDILELEDDNRKNNDATTYKRTTRIQEACDLYKKL